jgi:hypothetical protein
MFPTPKYARMEKNSMAIEPIKPRLVLAKIREKVKRRAVKRIIKNKNIAPNIPGSIK